MQQDFSYGKEQKLKSRKRIEALFANGKSFSAFPVKVFFLPQPYDASKPVQAGVGVSARNFKKAVDRNRIKRLMREAYRLNKNELISASVNQQKSLALFFLYVGKEMPVLDLINDKMCAALKKLEEHISR